jgi:hypothetical protein
MSLLLVSLLAGCVSLSPVGDRVVVTQSRGQIQGCADLGSMLSTSGWGVLMAGLGYENNERDMRNETAKRGGNTLLLLNESGIFSPTSLGQAYRCQK